MIAKILPRVSDTLACDDEGENVCRAGDETTSYYARKLPELEDKKPLG